MGEFLLAQFLRGTRDKIGLNQEAMAEILEVSSRTYQRIEAGESQLSASSFIRFLKKIDDDIFFAYMNSLHGNTKKGIASKDIVTKFLHGITASKSEEPKLYGLVKQNKKAIKRKNPGPLVGLWEWDFEKEAKYWSPEMYEIYGFENGYEFAPEELMERIFEGDHASIESSLENLIVYSIPYMNQHRTKYKDNLNYIVNSRAFLIPHEERYIVVGYAKAYKISKE